MKSASHFALRTSHASSGASRRGAAVLTAVLFFMVISLVIVLGASPVVLGESRNVRDLVNSKKSYFVAEGALEDAVYRLKKGLPVINGESIIIASTTVPVSVVTSANGTQEVSVTAAAYGADTYRKVRTRLPESDDVSFFYGVQAGRGGFTLDNNAFVVGNIHAGAPIIGSNGNLIQGDIISASSTGLISNVHATGSAFARTIEDSTIDKDAHYQSISGSTVGGVSYPNSPDEPEAPFPISDEQIDEWKQEALAGGAISSPCPYTISSNISLGPKKINCNLVVGLGKTLTLTGPLWVSGTITVSNNATVKIDSTLGSRSIAIIADDPVNRTTSSKIIIENNAVFEGTGASDSFVTLISQNNSAETGGLETAISYSNNSAGALMLYASHGKVAISNNSALTALAAYQIHLDNNASVRYRTGLANLNFSSGPGGGFDILNWEEF